MKVEMPLICLSPAPTRVNIESTTETVASSAGTYDPICAINTHKAIDRMNVDFPPIFGPKKYILQLREILTFQKQTCYEVKLAKLQIE